MPRTYLTPKYRQRAGYTQAITTLSDAVTGKRRDYWLGEHGTTGSREAYHRLIAEWESGGRRLPETQGVGGKDHDDAGVTVTQLIKSYWAFAKRYFGPAEAANFKSALRLLRQHYGTTPAAAFGPAKLRQLREAMIVGDAGADPPRRPWARSTINNHCRRIRQMFKWAVAHELISPWVHQGLCALEPLKRGRTTARESDPIGPAPQELIDAVKPRVSRQVRALIELQLLTGTRPGELLNLRAMDIDTSGPDGVWSYRPREHKNAYRGRDRTIHFGPAAQAVLQEFMTGRPLDAFMFSPREAEAERLARLHAARKTPLSCGNYPGSNRRPDRPRDIGETYTVHAYRRAIQRACDLAFPPPEGLGADERAKWIDQHRWHPHQLRHSAATEIRRQFGLEAAQLVLGHSSAVLTDSVYARRDESKVVEVMRKLG